MKDYDIPGPNYLVDIEEENELYLAQGHYTDEIMMHRKVEDLYEFERDSIQQLLGGIER